MSRTSTRAKSSKPRKSPSNSTKSSNARLVYSFGAGKADGREEQKELLGGKGANLHGMTSLGLPVPPGFTITTEVCTHFYSNKQKYPKALEAQVEAAVGKIERVMGRKFGGAKNPLLVSVRSGARASMPGMMDTILNLGLNDGTVQGLIADGARKGGSDAHEKIARFSYDSYRRFITMYSDVVLNIHANHFEAALESRKHARGVELDTELTADDLKELVREFKQIVRANGKAFPEDPWEQLWGAVGAVFGSWMSPRAITYRKLNQIPEAWGTAVTVQSMVFGNMGDDCATGVAFTRDPSTGERKFFGEFLVNAQGEDVVAGIRTPQPINEESRVGANEGSRHDKADKLPTLEAVMPKAYAQLVKTYQKLEKHYRDMQDIEFTIENGKLFMLQTRSGKRTAAAALKIACDMVREKLISKPEAINRVQPEQLDQLLHPRLDPAARKEIIAKGLPASPGAATGQVVFDPDTAETWVGEGKKVILVRLETSPEDIHGMSVAEGILTARGGMTCVAPETKILTDRGYLTAEQAFDLLEGDAALRILSFDAAQLKPVWRDIVAAGKKPSAVLAVSVSQTGRVEENTLRLTADHKMFALDRRQLVKKPLEEVLSESGFVTVVGSVPALGETRVSPALAYVAGALLSDGCIRLWGTKGSVTFIQKPTPEKADFIAAVERCFLDAFGVPFTYLRERTTESVLKGRAIKGSVEDRICFRRDPAERLAAIRDDLTGWVLGLDETALLSFLAGYVDGDGTYAEESSAVRLQISISGKRMGMLEGLATACLRLGIVPQVCANRENLSLQIAERVEDILGFTQRVRAEIPPRAYESRCLSVSGLFRDIVDHVNFMGRVREGIKRELMFGAEKIRRDILPLCPGSTRREVQALLDSPIRSFRIKQISKSTPSVVYNFEVDASDELDKNYIVFSSRMTPILISNSHAAVVARGMGKPCVSGCSALKMHAKSFNVGNAEVKEGDWITLDGATGEVIKGRVPTIAASTNKDFSELMDWVDDFRQIGVRTNADTPADSKVARGFGAEGIGLCRTEHMFFDSERIDCVREMILADTPEGRARALAKILPMQKLDFEGIFREMKGLPVTIRLLDPPLHEFIPHTDEELKSLAGKIGVTFERLKRKAETLHEFNPMLGHRGCRLGVSYPEIYRTQVRAIMEAACELAVNEGFRIVPEIMIPLVGDWRELRYVREYCVEECEHALQRYRDASPKGAKALKGFEYLIGTMIELPRAALTSNEIAEYAEFFSFGTNDLTQTTYGLSRDDSGLFLKDYLDAKIYERDPFASLDRVGVGRLMKISIEEGRAKRPDLKVGICGEHGGDPSSVEFCHAAGLDYVSCSPYRVPIARLAAAQAAIRAPRQKHATVKAKSARR